jgi:hypothetical protein
MTRGLIATFCLSALFMTSYSQQMKIAGSNSEASLTHDKPTIYLTFEREGKRERVHANESNRGVWLRLHNNTKWAINFCTLSLYIPPKVKSIRLANSQLILGLNDGVEVGMCHGVEELRSYQKKLTRGRDINATESPMQRQPQVGYDTGDVFSSAWLPSGSSVVFSVPREHLSKDLAIFVRFHYEWEYGDRTFGSGEPEHRVYFRASDLPENVQ